MIFKKSLMLGLLCFGACAIGQAILVGDDSTPYKNSYYVPCTEDQSDCVKDRCVAFGRGATLCIECQSGKVPINGRCVGADDPDSLLDSGVCTSENGSSGGKRCKACRDQNEDASGDTDIFLFYGGCYSKSEWPGSHICRTASGGACSVCETEHRYVFTSTGQSAAEKRILCGDTAGFGSGVGIDGCAVCVPLSQDSVSSSPASAIQCTACSTNDKAPIDGRCTDVGANKCTNGYCTHCAAGYVYHRGGCYSKNGAGNKVCAEGDLFEIAGYSACKKCVNASEVPHNGNCGPIYELYNCKKDASGGMCAACNQGFPGRTVFLYEGGCYNITDPVGGTVCTEAFNGRCTSCNEAQGYYKKDLGCGSCAAVIADCASCVPRSGTSDIPICVGCRNDKYAAVGGASCDASCSQPTTPTCTDGLCRCSCGAGSYLSTTTNSCTPCDPACVDCMGPGADGCVSCAPGRYIRYGYSGRSCVEPSECGDGYYANSDSYTCTPCGIDACKACSKSGNGIKCTACSSGYLSADGSSCSSECNGPNQVKDGSDNCVCVGGYTLRDGVCVLQAKRASSVPIAVGVAASVVGIMVVAFVCWLVLRRRRGPKSLSTMAGSRRLAGTVDEF